MRRNFRLIPTVKDGWQRIIQDMQQPMPVHYRSRFKDNIHSMSVSELLVYLSVCREIEQRWKRDIFTRIRIAYFYIWVHLMFGWLILATGLFYVLGMLCAVIGIAVIFVCIGGAISSIISIVSLIPEVMLMGLIGIVASGIAGVLGGLIFGMGEFSYNVSREIVHRMGAIEGIDILIFNKELYLLLFSLFCSAVFYKTMHSCQEVLPTAYVYGIGLIINAVMLVLGLVFFRVPKHALPDPSKRKVF